MAAAEGSVVEAGHSDEQLSRVLLPAKRTGMSDARIATLTKRTSGDIRKLRRKSSIAPAFKRVDTCAAEFRADTPYLYSTYEQDCEAQPSQRKKIMILGGGPNRIGQGIEFDYCCVHAVLALQEAGYETIMVNCNPETVSTDYDIANRLYFEPLTVEDVLSIVDVEKPEGVIVQFGGQTPLKLAVELNDAGVNLLGTSADAIDRAEDRERFGDLPAKARPQSTALGHRSHPRRSQASRRRHRLSRHGATVVRTRRPRDETRLRRNVPRHLLSPSRKSGPSGAHRPIFGRRHRGRRRHRRR